MIVMTACLQIILFHIELSEPFFALVEDGLISLQYGPSFLKSSDNIHILSNLAFLKQG